MIGFYNYTVILTYMSLISAITGMTFAHAGMFGAAIFCLALSGFFDMFDGKVARRKKDRTDDEKLFGIQLDSLCDVVAFGAFPAYLCYCMGVQGRLGFLAIIFYSICGVIRLAYFNVIETNNFFSEEEHEKVYYGLPITSAAVIFPLVYLLRGIFTTATYNAILTVLLFGVGMLFISNFKLRKPSNKLLLLICVVVAAALVFIYVNQGWSQPGVYHGM
ncbi:MAG: CDP-alcohol phosphatidyltransferase family protein [Firmicutes bacterium]|nr:CDP-alcohol phosphatidyltransferase family protein [Bacillota bacterium]